MHFSVLIQLVSISAIFGSLAAAHPGGHGHMSRREIARRQVLAGERQMAARSCAPMIRRYQDQRKAKRLSAMKRRNDQHQGQQQDQHDHHEPPFHAPVDHGKSMSHSSRQHGSSAVSSAISTILAASSTASAVTPYHTSISNYTCVTAPEVTEGPYYINNEMVRQDLRETQDGVTLILDIGVIDIETCLPLSNAFVELWNANATGVYGGYPATLGGGGGNGNGPMPSTAPISSMAAPSGNGSMGAMPTGTPGGPGGNGGGMTSTSLQRNETFLRGGYYTNSEGIVEITTIYPGFYSGRTPHMHTMVHMDWEEAANGTLISHAGTVSHIGQFFFNETWNDLVFSTSPYDDNTNERTYNDADSILEEENADGNNAFIDLVLIGADISDGLVGWVTMGVNASASYSITNTNYLNSTGAN